jgi:hypothetical protein
MSFLSKQPSVLPRVFKLCASQCPPHNVEHDIEQFPSYYDPIYFPSYHSSLFLTEQTVCQWLLMGLEEHSRQCRSCPELQAIYDSFKNEVCYTCPFFHVTFMGIRLSVSYTFVQCSSFSFCRLHRRFVLLVSKMQSMSVNIKIFCTICSVVLL